MKIFVVVFAGIDWLSFRLFRDNFRPTIKECYHNGKWFWGR